jgi:hypothetical protein
MDHRKEKDRKGLIILSGCISKGDIIAQVKFFDQLFASEVSASLRFTPVIFRRVFSAMISFMTFFILLPSAATSFHGKDFWLMCS